MYHTCENCGCSQWDYLKLGLCSTCYSKKWRSENRERYLARLRANYSPEKRSKYMRKWYQKIKKENPELYKRYIERRKRYFHEHKEHLRQRKTDYYKKRHDEFLAFLGEVSCIRCGYNKTKRAITFHHLDPRTKLFEITFGNWLHKGAYTKEMFEEEIKKCTPLCFNCHMELEAGLWQLEDLGVKASIPR